MESYSFFILVDCPIGIEAYLLPLWSRTHFKLLTELSIKCRPFCELYSNPFFVEDPRHHFRKPDCFFWKNRAEIFFTCTIKNNVGTRLKKIFLIQPGSDDFRDFL